MSITIDSPNTAGTMSISIDSPTTTVTVDDVTVASWEWSGSRASYENEKWTRDDIETVVARVNRGAQLLDKQEPGWREKILPEKLIMAHASFCIIGQVYGTYHEYVGVPFGMEHMAADDVSRNAIDHGFLTEIHVRGEAKMETIPYELLDRVWVKMIEERAEHNKPLLLELPPRQPRNLMIQLLTDADMLTA